jgi:hypothetical protein
MPPNGWVLAMDRTNWKFAKFDIELKVMTGNFPAQKVGGTQVFITIYAVRVVASKSKCWLGQAEPTLASY